MQVAIGELLSVSLNVSEIFLSIQGEGRLTGVPSIFVRLAGCDLACGWCDTGYARDRGRGRSLEGAEVLAKLGGYDCRHVVVTGGEPLLAGELPELLAALKASDKHITLETSATHFRRLQCDLVSISPKLANSTPAGAAAGDHERRRLNIAAIQQFIDGHDYQLKFAVGDAEDLDEVNDILGRLNRVDRDKVLLMPIAATKEQHRQRAAIVAQLCIEHGFRFCPRVHIQLWGKARGR